MFGNRSYGSASYAGETILDNITISLSTLTTSSAILSPTINTDFVLLTNKLSLLSNIISPSIHINISCLTTALSLQSTYNIPTLITDSVNIVSSQSLLSAHLNASINTNSNLTLNILSLLSNYNIPPVSLLSISSAQRYLTVLTLEAGEIDLGIRFRHGDRFIAAVGKSLDSTDKLRIKHNGTIYGVKLVDITDSKASPWRIKIGNEIKAVKEA